MLRCNMTFDPVKEGHGLTLRVTQLSVAPRFAAQGSAGAFAFRSAEIR